MDGAGRERSIDPLGQALPFAPQALVDVHFVAIPLSIRDGGNLPECGLSFKNLHHAKERACRATHMKMVKPMEVFTRQCVKAAKLNSDMLWKHPHAVNGKVMSIPALLSLK